MSGRGAPGATISGGSAASRWLGLGSGEGGQPTGEALLAEASRLVDAAPRLLLAAERAATSLAPGAHGRRRVGLGESFWQFRPFRDGDALSDVDWRQSARGDDLFVREHEWEAAQTVWVWLDRSASMDFQSTRALPSKLGRARILALAALLLMLRTGERVGVMGAMGTPATGQRGAREAAEALGAAGAKPGGTDFPGPGPCAPFSTLVLVSDFLVPLESLDAALRRAEDARLRIFLLQIADPAEERLPYRGRTLFEGPEAEGTLLAGRAEDLAAPFAARADAHLEGLKALVRRRNQRLVRHRTDRPPEEALIALAEAMATPRGPW